MRARGVLILAAALVLDAAVGVAAPLPAASRAPERGPDLFGGYSYTHAGEASLHGWSLVGSHPFRGAWRLVADLSGHYGSFGGADLSQWAFFAGARWTGRPGSRLRPFAESLVGAARTATSVEVAQGSVSDADVDWGVAIGGGVDCRLTERWSARAVVQLRLLRGESVTDEDPRFSAGAVYHFGR